MLQLGLWRDEASTYFDSIPNNFKEIINTVIHSELNPPVFFMIMHQWIKYFGSNEIVFKIPALLFGLLLIPSNYVLGTLTGSSNAGLIAATIATFSYNSVYYSQEARPYTLTALLCCWVMFFYCKSLDSTNKSQNWYIFAFTICSAILLYVQYTGLLLVIVLTTVTYGLSFKKSINLPLKLFAISFSMIFMIFTPWLGIFLNHLNTGLPWQAKSLFLEVLFSNIYYTLFNPKILVLSVVLLGAIITIRKYLIQSNSAIHSSNLFPYIYTFVFGLTFLLVIIVQSFLSQRGRYVIPFTPIAWAFYGSCLNNLFQYLSQSIHKIYDGKFLIITKKYVTIFIIFVALLLNKYNLDFTNIDKSGIRSLVAYIERRNNIDKSLYILSPDYFGPTFGYYTINHPKIFYGFGRWDRPEIFSPEGYAEIWDNPTLMADTELSIQKEIDKGFRKLALIQERTTLSDAGKMKYSKANQFLDRLKKKYTLLEKTDYLGENESVSLYLFDTTISP